MHQLKVGTLPLPKIFVAETNSEANQCRAMGVPYIKRSPGCDDDYIVKAVLWQTLKKKFPRINWRKVFDVSYSGPAVVVNVPSDYRVSDGQWGGSGPEMQQSDDYRESGGGIDPNDKEPLGFEDYDMLNLSDYVGDLGWHVNVEELQALHVLPTFLDDIATAIKKNMASTAWMDGYNKKLECNVGCYQGSSDAPNLIVLDVSGSIPSGVAGTMVSLIDTLRHQANADLIITSFKSRLYKANESLPDIKELNYLIGGCNECVQFYSILRDYIFGKHWGNVIIFGDNDAPEDPRFNKFSETWLKPKDLQSTRIDRIMAFHTYAHKVPGYGLWASTAAPKAPVIYNVKWVDSMS